MTNTQHRIERLRQVYFHNCREPFYTRNCEYINTIDFDNNTVYYVQYVQQSCGCCSYPEDFDTELTHILGFMEDDEFEEMIQHYITYKN